MKCTKDGIMADEKRVKKFATIDDILLSPGTALIYMEELRTQIYHMQKKLRKKAYLAKLRAIEDEVTEEVFESMTRMVNFMSTIIDDKSEEDDDHTLTEMVNDKFNEEERLMVQIEEEKYKKSAEVYRKYHK